MPAAWSAPERVIAFGCGRGAADITAALARLEAGLAEAGCPPAACAAFLVVAEEMVANVAHHAWPAGVAPGVFAVSAAIGRRQDGITVRLSIEDDGIPFDPTTRPAPDTDAPVEQREIGGLGIHLVMRMTERQCYRRKGDRNRFSVFWRCAAPPAWLGGAGGVSGRD